jgi:hypothetical protein
MREIIGILGFLLLIISAVFINTPFIALLAIPVFVAGSILILIFYLKQIDNEKRMNILSQNLIVIGVVMLCALLGYAAVQYNQFQGLLSGNQELSWNWNKIFSVAGINILASISIFIGIWKGNNYRLEELIILTIPIFLVIPVSIILIKLSVISGIWQGASI